MDLTLQILIMSNEEIITNMENGQLTVAVIKAGLYGDYNPMRNLLRRLEPISETVSWGNKECGLLRNYLQRWGINKMDGGLLASDSKEIYSYELYNEFLEYLGLVVCRPCEVRDKYPTAKYFMSYDYFTRQPTHFTDIDNGCHWELLKREKRNYK